MGPLLLVDDPPGIEVALVRPEVRPTCNALAFEAVCKRLYGADRETKIFRAG